MSFYQSNSYVIWVTFYIMPQIWEIAISNLFGFFFNIILAYIYIVLHTIVRLFIYIVVLMSCQAQSKQRIELNWSIWSKFFLICHIIFDVHVHC